jgi:hypothetical protein
VKAPKEQYDPKNCGNIDRGVQKIARVALKLCSKLMDGVLAPMHVIEEHEESGEHVGDVGRIGYPFLLSPLVPCPLMGRMRQSWTAVFGGDVAMRCDKQCCWRVGSRALEDARLALGLGH